MRVPRLSGSVESGSRMWMGHCGDDITNGTCKKRSRCGADVEQRGRRGQAEGHCSVERIARKEEGNMVRHAKGCHRSVDTTGRRVWRDKQIAGSTKREQT